MSSPASLLAQFPTEILGIIFSFSNTSLPAIRLWKCGDKRLNYRLCTGGITSISLKNHNPDSTSRFPKMLLSLQRLRSLSIDRSNCILAGAYELRNLLIQLNPALESLKLICREAESCFFRHPQLNELHGCFKPPTDMILETVPQSTTPGCPLWDIGAKFPFLNTLFVSCPSGSILSSCAQWLPSTLTDLSILAFDPCNGFKVRRYPPNLVHLTIGTSLLDGCIFPTSLKYLNANAIQIGDQNVQKLPAGLEGCDARMHFTPTTARSMPQQLRCLNASSIDIVAFEAAGLKWDDQLPRLLTRLTIEHPITLKCHHLRSFPRSMTSLDARKISRSVTESDFPPALVDLKCSCSANIVSKLPRQLTRLLLSGVFEDGCFTHLPPDLTSLYLVSLAAPYVFEFPHWPRSLTKLRVRRAVFTGPIDPTGPMCIKDRFPPNLQLLYINWETPHWEDLPDSLLTFISESPDPDLFCKLPPKLTKLITRSNPPTKRSLQGLPSSMTDLTIKASWPKLSVPEEVCLVPLEEDLFSSLPSSLKYLDFPSSSTDMLIHLPAELKQLRVKLTEVNEHCWAPLEETSSGPLSSSFLKYLVTEQSLKALPRNLWQVEFVGSKKSRFKLRSLLELVPPMMVAASRVSQGSLIMGETNCLLLRPLPVVTPDPRLLTNWPMGSAIDDQCCLSHFWNTDVHIKN